jgi:hypothetical protein
MNLKDVKEKYIFFTEIDLGDGDFVKLREPTIDELNGMNNAAEGDRIDELSKLFPACLVDHSFKNDDGGKSGNAEVYNTLKNSGSLFSEIISAWLASVPFSARLPKKQK